MRALVTGASHGLGRALTRHLLKAGYEVVAVDRDTDALDDLVVESRGACIPRMADLASDNSLARLMERISDQTFDLVILNAGINATGKFEEIPIPAYERLIGVNLIAPLSMASSLVGREQIDQGGKIVFIASLSHAVGYPGASVYAATKDAIASYARSVRKPFRRQGVGVLTVFPGPIRTAHAKKHAPMGADEAKRMAPEVLADKILAAAKGRAKVLYPGFSAQMAQMFGRMAPGMATRMMRRVIFDKLEGPEY